MSHAINILKIKPSIFTKFCRFTILLRYDEKNITIENHIGLCRVDLSLFISKISFLCEKHANDNETTRKNTIIFLSSSQI